MVAHRRCGKTVAVINDMVLKACHCPYAHGRYAYVAPLLSQAKEIAWDYLKRYSRPAWGAKPNESDLIVTLYNGAKIRLHGADNPDRLRGAYLDGVAMDEFGDMRPSIYGSVIRPMLADRGGWATFIGTPKGRNQFFKTYDNAIADPRWYHAMLKASETHILPQDELDDARIDMTEEEYEQEFECSFDAAIRGAYFGKHMAQAEREGRVSDNVRWEPALLVHTAWDLGIGDATAIWFFQVLGPEIRIIDYYERNLVGYDIHAAFLRSKPYTYGVHYVPHDAKVKEQSTGRTRLETLITDYHLNCALVPNEGLEDGINAARLNFPRFWFAKTNCEEGIEALRQYKQDYNEKTKAFSDAPKHDWTSHAADSFRYLALSWKKPPNPVAEPNKRADLKQIDQMTFEEYEELNAVDLDQRLRV